jgi:hypothetical protein
VLGSGASFPPPENSVQISEPAERGARNVQGCPRPALHPDSSAVLTKSSVTGFLYENLNKYFEKRKQKVKKILLIILLYFADLLH